MPIESSDRTGNDTDQPELLFILNQSDGGQSVMDHLMRTFAIAFAIVSGSYSSFRNVSGVSDNIPKQPFLFNCCSKKEKTKSRPASSHTGRNGTVDDEGEAVEYNYNLMHLIYAAAALYMMMTLTNWYEPETIKPRAMFNTSSTALDNIFKSDRKSPLGATLGQGGVEEIANGSFAIFWVKSATAFTCQFLFLVIVIGRLCFSGRLGCKWFQDAHSIGLSNQNQSLPVQSQPEINTRVTWTPDQL